MLNNIDFFEEDLTWPEYINKSVLSSKLVDLANKHHSQIEALNYIICSDDHLLNINQSYLGHDYYTDIITFPYKQGKIIEGDVFISLDRIKENAIEYHVDEKNELLRVIAHGLLHLIGFNDKTEKESLEMRYAEDEALTLILD
jgi:rRNA maturation RNase YbeY